MAGGLDGKPGHQQPALPGDAQRLGGNAQMAQAQGVHQPQGGEHRLEQGVHLVPPQAPAGLLHKAPQGHGGHVLVHGVGGAVLLEDLQHGLDHAGLPQPADALGKLDKVIQVLAEQGGLAGDRLHHHTLPGGQRRGKELPDLHRLPVGQVQGSVSKALPVSGLGPAHLVPARQHRVKGQGVPRLGLAVVPPARRTGDIARAFRQGGKAVSAQFAVHSSFLHFPLTSPGERPPGFKQS